MSYLEKEYKNILVELVNDQILVLTHNRPKAMNAINAEFLREKNEVFRAAANDPRIRVVITKGNERAFCAGGDLAKFVDYGVKEARDFCDLLVESDQVYGALNCPTIAMVSGACMGGGMEIMLASDMSIVADNAIFALPEINVGIFPGAGGTQRLPQYVPLCKAKEIIFTGNMFDAKTALELGLINKVVPLADLEAETMKLAKQLCKKPPFSLRMAKTAINAAWSVNFYEGMRIENHGWAMCYGTQDQKEGMKAFLEKRKPEFKGE